MARKSNKNKNISNKREISSFTRPESRFVLGRMTDRDSNRDFYSKALNEVEDRRRFSPYPYPLTLFGSRSLMRIRQPKRQQRPTLKTERWGFLYPKHTAVCVRRKRRRSVIHAVVNRVTKGAGGGSARRVFRALGQARKTLNYLSSVQC